MKFPINNLLWANEQSFSSVLNMCVSSMVVLLSVRDARKVTPNGETIVGAGVYYEEDLLFIIDSHRLSNDKYKAINIIRDCLTQQEERVFTRPQVEQFVAFEKESYDRLVARQLQTMESVHA